jgi:hypothetical protein
LSPQKFGPKIAAGFGYKIFWFLDMDIGFGYKNFWVLGLGIYTQPKPTPETQKFLGVNVCVQGHFFEIINYKLSKKTTKMIAFL